MLLSIARRTNFGERFEKTEIGGKRDVQISALTKIASIFKCCFHFTGEIFLLMISFPVCWLDLMLL
jgi:hypothetical protein